MRISPGDPLLALVSLAALGAANAGGVGSTLSGADLGAPAVVNLGLARGSWAPGDTLLGIRVHEPSQGGWDHDGDGDAFDDVLHVYDRTTGRVSNLRVAVDDYGFRIVGRRVLCSVNEIENGFGDLNGDGDALDSVPHVYDADAQSLVSLGSGWRPTTASGEGRFVGFQVREVDDGADLNGDGDTEDVLVRVVDVAQASIVDLPVDAQTIEVAGDSVLVGTLEHVVAQDLNEDGDQLDLVWRSFDPATGQVLNLRVAGSPAAIGPDACVVAVDEAQQGGVDLNGDGDAADRVLHLVELDTGRPTNLGIAVHGNQYAHLDERFCFTIASEGALGIDVVGDGDLSDFLPMIWDRRTGGWSTLELAVHVPPLPAWDGDDVVFFVSESRSGGRDLNQDGDGSDLLVALYEQRAARLTLLPESAGDTEGFSFAAGVVAYAAHEQAAGKDLNGDGDQGDLVVQTYDVARRRAANTGLAVAGSGRAVVGDGFLVVLVREDRQGDSDLNADGDRDDQVVFLRALASGRQVDTYLAGFSSSVAARGTWASFLVAEFFQGPGLDLNRDGDGDDVVVHVVDLADFSAPLGAGPELRASCGR